MTVGSSNTLEHVIGPTGRFHLRLLSGSIVVHGVDGDRVRVREKSGKAIADVFRIEAGEGSLSLTSPDRGGIDLIVFGIGRRSSLDLEVDVPRGADVTIETASAELAGGGLGGRSKVRTASGDIELIELGGSLELDAVSGDVDIRATGPLDLRARTISGDCSIRASELGRATVESTSGDIRLDALLAGPGPFEIQTVSGDVTIVGRGGVRVEARTVTGDLRSDLPHRLDTSPGRKQLIVGDGGTAIGFRSVSGDLRVVAPRDQDLAPVPRTAGSSPVALSSGAPAAPAPPAAPDPTEAARAVSGHEAGHEVARLDILRALERGELSVEAAMKRLADIEEA